MRTTLFSYRFLLLPSRMMHTGQSALHVVWTIEPAGDEGECLVVVSRGDGVKIAQLHGTRDEAEAHAARLCHELDGAPPLPHGEDGSAC